MFYWDICLGGDTFQASTVIWATVRGRIVNVGIKGLLWLRCQKSLTVL